MLVRAVVMLVVFSCLFYTLFLFDTLGDAVGFSQAYWVLIVTPVIPVVVLAGLYIWWRNILEGRGVVGENVYGDRGVEMKGEKSTEMKTMETISPMQHNEDCL